ncbi:MAG TPA: SAM-dependent methyltransferase [Mycobacteriales bacterium]|nr:SAM-dependent methyltransferase [Mycobacteriales bacterium]
MRTWAEAWRAALYGDGGFYVRGRGAGPDFRTPATADPVGLAQSLLTHSPSPPAVIDVGAGRGQLLAAFAGLLPISVPLLGVDVGPRPDGLPARVGWTDELPAALDGLVVAVELLDVVPCDVVVDRRVVLVDGEGAESPGPPPAAADAAWLDAWWPSWRDGDRAEVGRPRDELWADVAHRLRPGATAVMVDYGHLRAARPDGGTLTGFRDGRQVVPVPDGSMDLTAHVALDSVAAATGGTVAASPLAGWPRHSRIVLDTCP